MKNVKMYFPYPSNAKKIDIQTTNIIKTKKITLKEYSSAIRKVRIKVENPFGLMKLKWKSLNSKFKFGESEL